MNFKPPSFFMEAMKPVVAQIELKRKLAFAFSHYMLYLDDPSVGRSIPLVYGPSGSGKTFAVEICAEATGLPFTPIGGASVSAAGYKGVTLRDLLAQHFIRFRQSTGVIFIDEIDKWTRGAMQSADSEQLAMGMNKFGEILRYVEREDVYLQDEAKDIAALREHDETAEEFAGDEEVAWKPVAFETRKSFWIFAGAFERLHLIIKQRLSQDTLMDDSLLWEKAAPDDFKRYGMLSEAVNRCDVLAWVKPLKASEMMQIMEEQEAPKLKTMFDAIGCRLDLDPGALAMSAQLAVQERTGARGAVLRLRHVVSDCYTEADAAHLTSCRIDAHVMVSGHLSLEAPTSHQTAQEAAEPEPRAIVLLWQADRLNEAV